MFRSVILTGLLVSACSWQPIKQVTPIERGNLARAEMQLVPNAARGGYRQHVHESKSGSMPAANTGGGGCGCD